MTKQVIPDEAVEAAVEAHCEGTMRAALEAAAPYLMAQAWEEGWDTLADFDFRPSGPYPANPYR